jgi:hypothetical protein
MPPWARWAQLPQIILCQALLTCVHNNAIMITLSTIAANNVMPSSFLCVYAYRCRLEPTEHNSRK